MTGLSYLTLSPNLNNVTVQRNIQERLVACSHSYHGQPRTKTSTDLAALTLDLHGPSCWLFEGNILVEGVLS